MPHGLTLLGLFRVSETRPFAKAYIKPAGAQPNPTDAAVNPLLLMGLYRD